MFGAGVLATPVTNWVAGGKPMDTGYTWSLGGNVVAVVVIGLLLIAFDRKVAKPGPSLWPLAAWARALLRGRFGKLLRSPFYLTDYLAPFQYFLPFKFLGRCEWLSYIL